MARLTSNEVIAELERLYETDGPAYEHAAQLVRENLVPQWQDEPDEDGWHHLKGRDDKRPLYVRKFNDGWYVSTPRNEGGEYYQWEKLRCQVCPIGARPR